jgi:hypothetical protein
LKGNEGRKKLFMPEPVCRLQCGASPARRLRRQALPGGGGAGGAFPRDGLFLIQP